MGEFGWERRVRCTFRNYRGQNDPGSGDMTRFWFNQCKTSNNFLGFVKHQSLSTRCLSRKQHLTFESIRLPCNDTSMQPATSSSEHDKSISTLKTASAWQFSKSTDLMEDI